MRGTLLKIMAVLALSAPFSVTAFLHPDNSTGAVTFPSTGLATNRLIPGAEKIQSSLLDLTGVLNSNGLDAATGFAVQRGLNLSGDRVTVVIETGRETSALDSQLASANAKKEASYQNLVQASVPIASLSQLAASSSVSYIREPARPTNFLTSEGVADLGLNYWHAAGNRGQGAKIAVLDPGFSGYTNRVSEGELPANVIVKSFRSDGDITGGGEIHGTGCAEIAYDSAPGAQFYLVNFNTEVELGNAIDYLISQDVDVISSSWGFLKDFRADGQGPVNDMVRRVNDAGIFWANASGNLAQNHWSGAFSDQNNNLWTEFSGTDERNSIAAPANGLISVYLTWDSWPVTNQDYDLYLYWSVLPSIALASSTNVQNGTQAPSEEIQFVVPPLQSGTYYVMVHKYNATGNARFQLYTLPSKPKYQVAATSLGGQPTDSPFAMTVGAVPWGSTALEPFSSRGPTVDGRIKPDIVAPDRVSTMTYGSLAFAGTSASAPHIAGMAGVIKAGNPLYTPAMIQSEIEAMSTDLGAPGKDNLFGSGKPKVPGVGGDQTPPTVSNVQPAGTVLTANTTIKASYYDNDSGIDRSSVIVFLDGARLTGCSVGAASVSCPVSGMRATTHVISGSVADFAGNRSPISGSFSVVGALKLW